MANNQMIYGFEKNQITPYQHGIDPGIIANSTRIDPFKLDTSVLFKAQDMMIQQQQLDLQNRKMLMDNEQFKLEQDRLNKVYDLSKRQQDFQEAKDAYADINSASKLLDIPYLSEKEKGALSQYEQDVDNIISEYEKTDDYSSAQNKIAKFQMGLLRNKEVQGAMRKANNIKALYEAWNKDPDKYDISLIQETVRKAEAGDPSVNEFSFNPGNFRVYGAAEKQKSLMNAASGIFEKKEISKVEKDADGNEYIAKYNILPDKKETYNAFYNRIINDPIMSQSLNTDWENKKLSDKRAAELNGVPYVEDKNKKAFIDKEIGKMHSMFFDDYSAITKDDVVMTDKDYVSNPNIAGVGGSGKPTDTTLEAASLMREFNIDADSARRIASGGSRVVNINGELNWLDISNGTRTYSPTGIKVNSAPVNSPTSYNQTIVDSFKTPEQFNPNYKTLSAGDKFNSDIDAAYHNVSLVETGGTVQAVVDTDGHVSAGFLQNHLDNLNMIIGELPIENWNNSLSESQKFDRKKLNANDKSNNAEVQRLFKYIADNPNAQEPLRKIERKLFRDETRAAVDAYDKMQAGDGVPSALIPYLASIKHQHGGYRDILKGALLSADGSQKTFNSSIDSLNALHDSRTAYTRKVLRDQGKDEVYIQSVIERQNNEYQFAKRELEKQSGIKSTTPTAKSKSTKPDKIIYLDKDKTKMLGLQKRETEGEYMDKYKHIWVETPLKGKDGNPLMRRKTYKNLVIDGGKKTTLTLTKDGRRYVDSDMNKYWKIKEYDKGSPVFVEDGSIKDEDKVKLRKEFGIKPTTPNNNTNLPIEGGEIR